MIPRPNTLPVDTDAITAVQRTLATRYPALPITGVMDGPTRAALAALQHAAGIPVTGVADRATQAVLDGLTPVLAAGAELGAVKIRAPTRAGGQLRGAAKMLATVIGMTLTLLTMISGLGFIPADMRDIIAVLIAGLTPIAVYFIPNTTKE